jgi:hypothetical protein
MDPTDVEELDDVTENLQFWKAQAPCCPACGSRQVQLVNWGPYHSNWKCRQRLCRREWVKGRSG